MNKKTGIIIGVLVVAFLALVGVSLWQKSQEASEMGDYRLSTITDLIDQKDKQGVFADGKYDFTKVIPANEDSGNLPENVNGDPKAPVVIVEYADYQCDYCAPMNPYVNKIVEEYDGKVAVVMRTYILSYHNNGVAAAAAANALGLFFCGVDLLFTDDGFCVCEVNGNAAFRSLPEGCGVDLPAVFMRSLAAIFQ